MPDIKTALATALKEWEPPTEGTVIAPAAPAPTPAPPKPRPSLTRDTFVMVRENPGISRANAIERLKAMGHKPVSTSSILYQLVRARMIDEADGALSTKRKNYTSLTHALEKAPKGRRKTRVQKPKKVPVIGVLDEVSAADVQKFIDAGTTRKLMEEDRQRVSNEIDEWLNGVTLRYASLVYERLHYIFGANK